MISSALSHTTPGSYVGVGLIRLVVSLSYEFYKSTQIVSSKGVAHALSVTQIAL